MRSCALIEAMLGTLMLSSLTPSPARIIAPRGSPATPPQTPTHFPAAVAPRDAVDEPQHHRMQTVDLPGQRRVHAVHREGVLREVVRPDGEEIDFPRELRGHERGRRNFDHDPDLDRRDAEFGAHLFRDFFRRPQIGERSDHREHDLDRPGVEAR